MSDKELLKIQLDMLLKDSKKFCKVAAFLDSLLDETQDSFCFGWTLETLSTINRLHDQLLNECEAVIAMRWK